MWTVPQCVKKCLENYTVIVTVGTKKAKNVPQKCFIWQYSLL